MAFNIVKRRENYTDKQTAEVKHAWRYYLVLENGTRIQIRASFKDDSKLLYSIIPLDPAYVPEK